MKTPADESLIERIDGGIAKVEAFMVVAVMSVMVGLASLNFVLHKVFGAGFDWADIVVRQMVLWVGFLGGALATYEGRHIAIDAVGKFLSPRRAAVTRVITSIAASIMAIMMLGAAVEFIRGEIEDGSKVFGEMPAWPFEAIIPVAFAAISFHFIVAIYRNYMIAVGKREPPEEYDELEHAHEFHDEAEAEVEAQPDPEAEDKPESDAEAEPEPEPEAETEEKEADES